MRNLKLVVGLIVLGGLFGGGCGSSDGPGQFNVSGRVTFDGKAVPAGTISFEPDASKGATGPGAVAQIKDGRYATERGKSPTSGPHVVRIIGYDGVPSKIGTMEVPEGKALFPPYETRADLPKAASQHDFQVPASAAGGKTSP
jgi:hypothetical protein